MSLLHPALLYGLLLAAVPVVLHLLMRARPKKLDFPALRLLANIRKQNSQRMRLRHIGLLLLRILLLVLFVLAIARPTLPAANYSFTSGEWLRLVIVVLLVGTAYWAGTRYWVAQTEQRHQQLFRKTYLRAGTISGLLLLFLLMVAWPWQRRVFAEIRNPGEQLQLNVPISAVLLFDTSASMGYRFENQNRLEQASALALEQVRGFPDNSQVAITTSNDRRPIAFLKDLKAAETRLQQSDSLAPQDISLTLNDRILAAVQLQVDEREEIVSGGENEQDDRFLREIYIYTDGSRSAWSMEEAERMKAEIERVPWLRCYVINVGVERPINFSITNLETSKERVVQGSLVRVNADVTNDSSAAKDLVIDLYLDKQNGSLVKRDQQLLTVPPGEIAQVSFTFQATGAGVFQGELRLSVADPLAVDDAIGFSIDVEPRPRVWLVAEEQEEAFAWQQALAPEGLIKREVHQYDIEVISPNAVSGKLQADTNSPELIYLINVARLSAAGWEQLEEFVKNGGGLGVVLGSSRIDKPNYRDYGQADWLPALPSAHTRARPSVNISVSRTDHPVFSYLEQLDALTVFGTAGVYRYFKTDVMDDAFVLANFQDDGLTPAVIGKPVGSGRVIVITTAVDLKGAAEQKNWSDLVRLGWIYAAWADRMSLYLRSGESTRLNRIVGEPMVLSVDESLERQEGLLQLPGLVQGKITIPYRTPLLSISTGSGAAEGSRASAASPLTANLIGNYRLVFPEQSQSPSGFTMQLNPAEPNLKGISHAELDELFGADRWQLSKSYEELERTVLLGRIGQEAYPMLLALLIVFFLGEHIAANLFYGRQEG